MTLPPSISWPKHNRMRPSDCHWRRAAFADCEGGKEVPVHVRLEGNDVVVAEWVDGGVPQVRRYSVTQDDANWFERPCSMRLLKENPIPYVVLSQGITGSGIELFRQTTAQSLEGVVAKRLNSRYLPGRRTDAWVKIKNGIELFCCIIGYEPSGTDDFGKLILAHEVNGKLCGVGSVGTGFDAAMRQRLNAFLWTHRRSTPVVKCGRRGIWVEPQLVCRVTCMELTRGGEMRTAVFHELVKE
jgi:hypothetical protein